MNLKHVKRSAMSFALIASFVLPQASNRAWAATETSSTLALNLFPEDDDTGLSPTTPTITPTNPTPGNGNGGGRPGGGSGGSGSNSNSSSTQRPNNTKVSSTSSSKTSMKPASVAEEYKCPVFDNRPHAELISAIDALSKEVQASPECTGQPSAKALSDNGNALKEHLAILQGAMALQDPNAVNIGQIDQSMTAAITAVGNVGDILNNNAFLNSKCGRQTMSAGKTLLAFNDVLTGLAPYALFAVSLNAALAPALPFVIGGAIATSGISAFAKMIDQNTLDMTNPEYRKALLINTCQYTRVHKKVRFMQLAQSGRIDKITQELEKEMDSYAKTFTNPSAELSSLLKYRDSSMKYSSAVENQLANDRADLQVIQEQVKLNNDDLMVCTLANELVNWAADGKTFPSSAFVNLERSTAQGDRAQKLQALTMKSVHTNSMKKIQEAAAKASESDSALKACAQAGRSWFSSIQQSVTMTGSIISTNKQSVETELSKNKEYSQWKAQYTRLETQKVTVSRVEKAMQELAKDSSVIDRSELAQRMVNLKSGLFGSRTSWGIVPPPVLAWINHTKTMHDQAISAFDISMKAVRADSYSLTEVGRGKHVVYSPGGGVYVNPVEAKKAKTISEALSNLTLKELPMGSREHELVCQRLEGAWLDWSAAFDHLGSIKLFCDMIDPVLDVKMDTSVISTCRGVGQINGTTYRKPIYDQARETLVRKGFQADASRVSAKMKELKCPMPDVSVMN